MEEWCTAITKGYELYVKLREGSTTMPALFVKIVRNLKQELEKLWSSNEWFIKVSEEQ